MKAYIWKAEKVLMKYWKITQGAGICYVRYCYVMIVWAAKRDIAKVKTKGTRYEKSWAVFWFDTTFVQHFILPLTIWFVQKCWQIISKNVWIRMKNDFVCQEKGRQHHSARPKTENILWLGYSNDILTSSRSSTCAIVTLEI